MQIVVAPDSYKGSLSAVGVADAMERGILSVFPDATVVKVPIADGGEGTVEALVGTTGKSLAQEDVMDPLGRPITAAWGVLGDRSTAVVEMAAASGLTLLTREERNPLVTTTFGTGQLILAALDRGYRRLILGIGGSATNDGGTGMARALGARFLDEDGQELPHGGGALSRLATLDVAGMDPRLAELELLVACDVDNPLCGPNGASAIYGPQKGATPSMVAELDAALGRYAGMAAKVTGRDIAGLPGAGAAGGLGAGLLFFTGAHLRPGVQIVLEASSFTEKLKTADLVITGEGLTDHQTVMGKAPVGVAAAAAPFGVPVIGLSGGLGQGSEKVLEHGIAALMSIAPGPMALDACMAAAGQLVEEAAARLCRLLRVGQSLNPKPRP